MDVVTRVLDLIENPQAKSLLEIGAHDDLDAVQFARRFHHVYSYYEFLKIPERAEANLDIRKLPYLTVLEQFARFDVILLKNEFHHFPDIWQLWTFERLSARQELLLLEWDFTGSNDYYYGAFQNCRPLCQLTRELLNRCVRDGLIEVQQVVKGRYDMHFTSRQEMIDFYRFLLPDHWRFGEREFDAKIAHISYPVDLWEGYDLFKIQRL